MKYEAAIIHGPRGPFAVLRATPDRGDVRLDDEARRAIKQCFREKHEGLPVVFLTADSPDFNLISDEPLGEEMRSCISGVELDRHEWQPFELM